MHANINNNAITALNVWELPKFLHSTRNLGRVTRSWRQILDRKWKYGYFAHEK